MAFTVQARTSRTARLCDTCHFTPSLRGVPTIAPGHRYLRHTAFPGDEVNQSNRPYTSIECVACAGDREETDPLLLAGACATFCHGVVPCARPLNHGDGHSCRECMADRIPTNA